ncbi:MAG: DUF4907 domain-containing protein [Crocinitomicaceae bacterium]|nr:DUF4907 domain-containing protein [Crocinitomicaceae bacterium]
MYEYGKLFIHQPHIPAVQGNKGFHQWRMLKKLQNSPLPKCLRA